MSKQKRTYGGIYLEICRDMETRAREALGRELNTTELQFLRNAGTLMMQESVDQGLTASIADGKLDDYFAAESGAFESRRVEWLTGFVELAEKALRRSLSNDERERVLATPYLTDWMEASERLPKLSRSQAESFFANLFA